MQRAFKNILYVDVSWNWTEDPSMSQSPPTQTIFQVLPTIRYLTKNIWQTWSKILWQISRSENIQVRWRTTSHFRVDTFTLLYRKVKYWFLHVKVVITKFGVFRSPDLGDRSRDWLENGALSRFLDQVIIRSSWSRHGPSPTWLHLHPMNASFRYNTCF